MQTRLAPLFAALAAALVPVHAAAPPCFEDWWKERIGSAEARPSDPAAVFPLRQVFQMMRTAPDPDEIAAALEAFRARGDAHPLVAAEIDVLLLQRDIAQGDSASARIRASRLGIVTRLRLAGPLKDGKEQEKEAGFHQDPARWRTIETGLTGLLPLGQLVHPSSRTWAVVVFYVRATKATSFAVRYGADDRARVAVDGVTVLDPPERHDIGFDQHAAFAEVGPGWHRIALWIEQDDDAWGAVVRVTAPDGRPLDPGAAVVEMPADPAAVERELRAGTPSVRVASGVTLTALFEKAAAGRNPPARARALRAADDQARALPDRSDPRVVTIAREAAAAAPDDVDVQWIRAIVDSDPARRREALEAILARDPTHPGALRRLAGYHLEHGRMDASIEEARRSREACGRPDPYLQGWEALARDHRGFPAGAYAAIDRLIARYPRQIALIERMGELARREGLPQRARTWYERLLAIDRTNDRARSEYLGLLAETGDEARSLELIREAVAIDPADINWRLRLVRRALNDGRLEDASREVRAALALAPQHPGLLELSGEVRLAQGDAAGAEAAWRSALGVAQDQGTLTERIAALTGADDSFGAEWTVSLDDARATEARVPFEADPAALVLSKTAAYRVRPDGLSSNFQQTVIRVRRPDEAGFARSISFAYSPSLQRATVVAARLVRRDGTVVLAARSDRPLVPDLEIRMWYDTRIVDLTFPRLEEGDLIDVRWRTTDRGSVNPLGEGYFGDVWAAGEEVPVLAARLVLEAPAARPVAWRMPHLPRAPDERTLDRDGTRVTIVDLPPLPAFAGAPLAPPATARLPYAIVGTTGSWEELGRLYARLIRDQAATGPDLKSIVRDATAKAKDRRAKIRALYDWVIENTRYVALELGIHALKPYDVPSVLKRRFGDCKDKATLLATMLREAGIDAQVTLVRTRDRGPIDTTVPTFAAFDHAIVHVPAADGIEEFWLDGTVMHHALGETPAPDRNALALVIDESAGGRLVTIPEMTPDDAFTAREEEIDIGEGGTATLTARVVARGDDAGRERSYFRGADRPGNVLGNRLRRAHPDVSLLDASFQAVGLDDPEVRYGFKARVERFARSEGDGLSFPVGFAVPGLPIDQPPAGRAIPLELPPPYRQRLASRIDFPPGQAARELPRAEIVESPWGRLAIEVRDRGRGIDVVVDLAFRGGSVPVDRLTEFASFVEQVEHATESRIVLRPR